MAGAGPPGLILADWATAAAWVGERQRMGDRVVMTNGCFDLLHAGHVRYLRAARALGEALLVGLNADAAVWGLKGPGRPLVRQEERAEVLSALRWVDAVVLFDEPTAEGLVEALRPAIYTKGGDYAGPGAAGVDESRLPEARVVRSYGGQVVLLPYHDGHSTTTLIRRLRAGLTHDPA
jgi:rfaE bifunctional protein nucleotidyltransferase chain/domain